MRCQFVKCLCLLSLLLGSSPGSWATDYTFTTIDVPGGFKTDAVGINNAGQIVGEFRDATGAGHGFLDTAGTFTTIDVPGAFRTSASGINDAGQIVGFESEGVHVHGF